MSRFRTPQCGVALSLILGVIWLTGCGGSQATSPPPPTVPPKAVVTTNPLVPTPQAALAQEPFQGAPKYPDVYLLTAAQRKSDLASFLYTTVRDLDRVNPGVPDPIPSGTLVAIPYDYLVTQPKPFASIAAETGLSKEVLFTYNPVLRNTENLAQGTRLVMPRLLIVSDVTQLSAAVERLAVSRVALMQANPNLAGTEKLLSGTVLILPPEDQP